MTEKILERCEIWQAEMDQAYPDRPWLPILEAFLPSGAADARQLCLAVGLERDQMRRPLKKLEAYGVGSQAILRRFEQALVRPGERGRAPTVYLLGEAGAAMLRLNGHETARACALKDKHAVLHALCMEDVHLAALRCERQIITDQTISYGENQALRPDHQVTLSDGRKILFEVEQIARPQLVRRISDSLRHKQAFFTSQDSAGFLPQVRMLVGLPRGRDWFRTLRVWREVCQALAEEVKDELAFQLLALPLTEFLAQPEWDEAISDRWEDLTRQAQQDAQGKSETDKQGLLAISRSRRRKPGDDYLLLSALLQRYQENVQDERPSAEFLPLMHLIYSASHPERREYWVEAGLPHASIYLLKQYLEAHPDLLKLLQQTTHRGRGRIRWGINTIFHRMQSVANVFLAYHGWRANGLLRVRATDQPDCGRDYGFHAEMSGQLPQFAWHQVTGTEFSSKQQYLLALTWVLWALFEYGEDLGLGTPEFW